VGPPPEGVLPFTLRLVFIIVFLFLHLRQADVLLKNLWTYVQDDLNTITYWVALGVTKLWSTSCFVSCSCIYIIINCWCWLLHTYTYTEGVKIEGVHKCFTPLLETINAALQSQKYWSHCTYNENKLGYKAYETGKTSGVQIYQLLLHIY
jgi:hypothetical protein